MAKTAEAVDKFLTELADRMKPLRDKEMEVFKQYKQEEV